MIPKHSARVSRYVGHLLLWFRIAVEQVVDCLVRHLKQCVPLAPLLPLGALLHSKTSGMTSVMPEQLPT